MTVEQGRYKRILLYPDPGSIYDAARFLVYSLLISNNARRDALAQVRVAGKWIIAPGDRIRHLRPDADTSEGWVRAVLRGKRLGAWISEEPLLLPEGRRLEIIHVPNGVNELSVGSWEAPVVACLTRRRDGCGLGGASSYKVPDWGVWRTAVLLNILLDRVWRGWPPVRC